MDKIEQLLSKQLRNFHKNLEAKLENKFDVFEATIENSVAEIRSEVNKLTKQMGVIDPKCSQLNKRVVAVEDELKTRPKLMESTSEVIIELNERKKANQMLLPLMCLNSEKLKGKTD